MLGLWFHCWSRAGGATLEPNGTKYLGCFCQRATPPLRRAQGEDLLATEVCMSSDPSGIDLRLLDAQVRNLTINATVVYGGERASTSVSAVSRPPGGQLSQPLVQPSTSASTSTGAGDRAAGHLAWAHRTTSVECPPSVLRLGRNLRSGARGSGEERVTAAYRKGREAAVIIRGEVECYASDTVTARGSPCRVHPQALRYFQLQRVLQLRQIGPGGTWNPDSVSHGFASQA